MDNFLTDKQALEKYIQGCEKKSTLPLWKLLVKGIIAGIMIGLGAGCSSVAGHSITNIGLARLAIGAVFPVGLIVIILLGAELFTGDCLAIVGVLDKKTKWSFFFKLLVVVFIGNFIGAVIMCTLTNFSGQWNYSEGLLGAYNISVAVAKSNISFVRGLTSGILCNILVCGTVMMSVCAKDVAGKLLSIFFGVFIFAVSGFEHCVANMYYLTAGLYSKLNPAYVELAKEAFGLTAEQIDALSVTGYITNLVPVTLGNLIGGAVFIGAALFFLNKSKKEA